MDSPTKGVKMVSKIIQRRMRLASFGKYGKIDICMEIIARITREKALPYPECMDIFKRIAKRWSGNPDITLKAIESRFNRYGHVYILKGCIQQEEKYEQQIEFNRHRDYLQRLAEKGSEEAKKNRIGKNQCYLCRKWGDKRYTNYKSDVHGWDCAGSWFNSDCATLCIGCWNKIKPIAKAKREADEIKYLSNKLQRGIYKWQKSQQQAN